MIILHNSIVFVLNFIRKLLLLNVILLQNMLGNIMKK